MSITETLFAISVLIGPLIVFIGLFFTEYEVILIFLAFIMLLLACLSEFLVKDEGEIIQHENEGESRLDLLKNMVNFI
jgi:hypothetical protein